MTPRVPRSLTIVIGALLLAACAPAANPPAAPTAGPRLTVEQPTLAPTVAPTVPPAPTATPPPTASPAPTSAPTATPAPTRRPAAQPEDAELQDLLVSGYKLLLSAAVDDAAGRHYVAYLLTNTRVSSVMLNPAGPPESGLGVCVLAFYRWDGFRYVSLGLLGQNERLAWCEVVNWDAPEMLEFYPFAAPAAETRAALGLTGYWSDLNGNGQPELAVLTSDCLNECDRYQGLSTRYYELTTNPRAADLAAGLPGLLLPDHLLYRADPATLFARAYRALPYEQAIEYDRLVAWDGARFAEVSAREPEALEAQRQAVQAALDKTVNQPLPPYKAGLILTWLELANAAGRPADSLPALLEVTDPARWPATPALHLCWLQGQRAYAQLDAAAGRPYRTLALDGVFLMGAGIGQSLLDALPGLDPAVYDLSACQ